MPSTQREDARRTAPRERLPDPNQRRHDDSEMDEPRVTKRSEAVERAAAIGLIESTAVPPPPDFYQSG